MIWNSWPECVSLVARGGTFAETSVGQVVRDCLQRSDSAGPGSLCESSNPCIVAGQKAAILPGAAFQPPYVYSLPTFSRLREEVKWDGGAILQFVVG